MQRDGGNMCPVFDFRCDKCGKTIEHLTRSDTYAVTCECGGLAKKQLSMPKIMLDGTDPSLPGAYDKWGRDREKRAMQERKKSYYEG